MKVNEVPLHIAVIPDGNRRWAKEKKLSLTAGHEKSAQADNLICLFDEAKKVGVRYFSIWGFSTENWGRSEVEKKILFQLITKSLRDLRGKVHEEKIRFRHFGRRDRLPKRIINEIEKLEKETLNYSDFNINLCLDYGGRDEILRVVNRILKEDIGRVDEETFQNFLDSRGVPDVDLIIRTSGEKRTSGIMPFQSVYAELYFSDVMFPDFNEKDLRKALNDFSRRKRRFGGD